MKIFKNDFDKIYEDLSILNEDVDSDTQFNFDGNLKDLATSNNLTQEDWTKIRAISEHLVWRFDNKKSNGKPVDWWFQFQLMYNAYQTECKTIELLNDTKFVEDINETFIEETLKNRLSDAGFNEADLESALKATKEFRSKVTLFDGKYDFNSKNHQHNIFAVSSKWNPFKGEDVVDIHGNSEKAICKYIEAKGTTGDKYPNSLHNSSAVFVYRLDTDSIDIYVKGAVLKPVVSEMLAIANLKEVETADIENNTQVTKKGFNFTDEYIHIKTCEDVGIQAKCISVSSPKVPIITKFTPRASK